MRLAALSACLATIALPALAAPVQPPQPTTSTIPGKCTWHWQTGAGLGVWTERCEANGVWELTYRADLPGFALTIDGAESGAVIHVFQKPAGADIAAILPELRKRGLIPDDDECIFAPVSDETLLGIAPLPPGRSAFEIVPMGKRKATLDATPADEVPEPPCGEYGWGPEGVRYFITDRAHPSAVVYLNLCQDGTMFDPATVTLE